LFAGFSVKAARRTGRAIVSRLRPRRRSAGRLRGVSRWGGEPNRGPALARALVSRGGVALLVAAFALRTGRPPAAPPWWSGDRAEVPQLAAQTGKGVVLYFETPEAEGCQRMEAETWSQISAREADENFIWMRLQPERHPSFFSWWQIHQVPEIVVLDSRMGEQRRFKGYVGAEELLEKLSSIPRDKPSVLTTTDGRVVAPQDPTLADRHREETAAGGHFFYESFDGFRSLEAIDSPLFIPISKAASRIDPKAGLFGSPCLTIDSGLQSSAALRLDVSHGLERVAQIEGRVRVRVLMQALDVGEEITEVAALTIVKRGEPLGSIFARHFFLTLSNRHSQWYEREVASEPFNFRTHKAYLTFQVNAPGKSFMVEDVRVDLLPADAALAVQVGSASERPPLLAPPTEPAVFRSYDKNGDGRIGRDEVAPGNPLFDALDLNGDGYVTLTEVRQAFGGGRPRQP